MFSDVFETMFKEEWSDGKEIQLAHVTYESMVHLIKSIHLNAIDDTVLKGQDAPKKILELFKIAHQYQVQHVIEACEQEAEKLELNTDSRNDMAFEYLIEGERRSNKVLVSKAIQSIVENPKFNELDKPKCYSELTKEMMEMVMFAVTAKLNRYISRFGKFEENCPRCKKNYNVEVKYRHNGCS